MGSEPLGLTLPLCFFSPLLELKDQPWQPRTRARVFSCSVSGRVDASLRSLTPTLWLQERERGCWSEKHRLVIPTLFLLLGLSFWEPRASVFPSVKWHRQWGKSDVKAPVEVSHSMRMWLFSLFSPAACHLFSHFLQPHGGWTSGLGRRKGGP